MLPSLVSAILLAVLPVAVAPGADPGQPLAQADQPGPPPAAAAWLGRVSPGAPGAFPPPRSFDASYRITWADLDAAHLEVHSVSDEAENTIRTTIKTAAVGGARLLYKSDGVGVDVTERRTLRPLKFDQTEDHNGKHSVSHVVFDSGGATRTYGSTVKDAKPPTHGEAAKPSTPRRYDYPGLLDMQSALLVFRSQPMANGDERRFIIMSATSPYLATIKVISRERVKVKAGDFPAIKCSVSLQKISKRGELEAYKSLKQAFAWISDDADRLIVKVETQIFVGSVNLELEKSSFPAAPAH